MKIAFLTISTNKYIKLALNLFHSLEKFAFLDTGCSVDFLVFSNLPEIFNKESGRIISKGIMTTHVPFPLISLLRYQYYSECEDIKNYDYVFHLDCDMELKDGIGMDIVGERVCVQHPGFFLKRQEELFPYERNPISSAFVVNGSGDEYYQNCFQGGSSVEFFNMCKILNHNIIKDLKINHIAIWHDESHMNRYMIDNPPSLVLPPTYAQPQFWQSFGETKIIHLDKDHDQIRM